MKISKLQLVYLAVLSMLGFVATDMYLPAFKAMEIDFATGPEQIALSLTVFLGGMAFGQLMWGLASDKFGHRNTLAAGLVVFTLASFGLAFCDQVWQLLSLRFVQAIGVCAPAVIWQAMVIKRYSSSSQQIFATIMPLVALSPALAPQLGVVLADNFGWHSIFITLTLVGVLLVVATMMQKDEKVEVKQTSISTDIKALLGSKTYLGNVTMFATASAAFFAYLTGMPEIMAQLGYEAKDIGMSFIPQTIAFMAGGYLGKVGVRKYGDKNVLRQLIGLFSVAALMVFVASQWTLTSIWPILTPFCLIAVANGALYPIVVNRALESAHQSPATAAGLQNSLQICVSSLASAFVAAMASQAQSVTGIAIVICMAGLWVGYILSNRELAKHFATPDNSRVVSEE
ncbi:purine nucleoside transporter PunC [Vibrio natriegens]|jgi:Bcr/CflA subfamily drug resistance transporter|uniref:Bcr/CflA family efflux transporter n=1 Tax=Vibrio natriegens NBRC 15636 = ATCC 14048 = DSM 759 TaxID=1219067 RepID=A0AAN0Y502_VIBNA|nr:purine nucleoside transporter PunC [Vibrio natriegens]ALR16911.1 transporter [Vibrio natriegens NBRC 15636 = ATCC 14048 = DSM 759]ANQ13916.1 Bcr/CflA family multidrug efflux transporter [Vibrio natriegens NBRC 15636 = ATCC 14048 = DSM 759]EPM41880.1 transporter [Vibrio natriegens NBRC 15636 = ATCC 14048 = DSM 759]MDX6025533.1 purine nucleoside transporter PunC [Vibrio natriegens NBRC 15636 = ATCC 14048 = DSM 759]UUI11657.1 purine nucleoside transporter PunC [Vibrio natriegens]